MMKSNEYVQSLIDECKESGQILNKQVKGLTEDELHTLIIV